MKQLSALKFTFQGRNITVNSKVILIEDGHLRKSQKKIRVAALDSAIDSNRCSCDIRVILQPLISLAFV